MTLRHDGSLHDEGSDVVRNFAANGDSECGTRHPEGWGCTRTAGHDGRHEAGYPVRRGGVRLCAYWEDQSKNIGTKCETAIVRYVRPNGFGGADETSRAQRLTLAGAADQGDIGVCPGVMIESKGGHAAEQASDAQIAAWLEETERERLARGAEIAALVVKRKGKGYGNAGAWHAYLPGWTFVQLADTRLHIEPGDPCPAVRITLAEFVTLLRRAGYGDPIGIDERTTP